MDKLVSLEEVDASVLPAKVLVLLSKYSQAVRKHTGLVIKISSLNIFQHIHNTQKLTDHLRVQQRHQELLIEVNSHLRAGTMRTHKQQQSAHSKPLLRDENGQLLVSRTNGRLNSNNLDVESSLSISL